MYNIVQMGEDANLKFDLGKSTWRPNFKSEYSMFGLDFERYAKCLSDLDSTSGLIHSVNVPSIELVQRYFAQLNVLYLNWRSLMNNKDKTTMLDGAINEAIKRKRQWETSMQLGSSYSKKLKLELVDLLNKFHMEILQIKQVIGIGIPVKRILSAKQKIKAGMNKTPNWEGLPEP